MGLSVNRKGRPVAARGRLDRRWLVTGSWRQACLAPWGDQGGGFITSRSPT